MSPLRTRFRPSPVMALALAGACGGGDLVLPEGPGDGPAEPSASRSTLLADPASIPARTGTSTITVQVRDAEGDPVEGAVVALEATGVGNTLEQPPGATGPDGIAAGSLRSDAPGEKVVSAVIDGSVEVNRTAVVTVTPGASRRLEAVEGDDQTAPAGARVPVRPAVRVIDEEGLPVPDVEVRFAVTGGGGSVDDASQATNAEGIARVGGWTLGPSAGTNTLEARAEGLEGSPVVFRAEATRTPLSVDRLVYLGPPRDVRRNEEFTVRVALVDENGEVVPLSGIFVYVDLFQEGRDTPNNPLLQGERFENTEDGIATLDLSVNREGRYRLRALTDDLPELGPHGPEPWLFSQVFEVD